MEITLGLSKYKSLVLTFWFLALGRIRETQLLFVWLFGIWITCYIGPPLDKMPRLLICFSSLKKLNNCWCVIGIHTEVTTLKTTPDGSFGIFILFWVITLTYSPRLWTWSFMPHPNSRSTNPNTEVIPYSCVNRSRILLPAHVSTGWHSQVFSFQKHGSWQVFFWSPEKPRFLQPLHY